MMRGNHQMLLNFPPEGGPVNDYSTHVGMLTEVVWNWAEKTFPDRTDVSMYLKMYGEIAEMIESDGSRDEIADMFILLLDYAKRKKIDITRAVLDKIAINHDRKWAIDHNGVASHVKPEASHVG